MLAQSGVGLTQILVVVLYLLVVVYLGWLGYSRTKTATDYLVAGRKIHPFVMAMSYGATFISTSAIVGFGGVAGLFGMSVLWLTFCNIFVGIFIAFVVLAPPARRMGHRLDAHTFPELLGRRYESKFVQVFAGLVIFLFIPLYAAAVLIGGCEFISTQFNIDYNVALLVFSVIIAAYVVMGGLKGVMYSDALQGSIMFLGMLILLIFTYAKLGGVTRAHTRLTDLAPLVPGSLQSIGHRGWTAMPAFGFGDPKYNLWWIVISTITLGVGIGVLAQPQLVVRFMTVKSRRELNRAVAVGGVFIIIMTGVAFTVGSLSNAYLANYGDPMTGRVAKMLDEDKGLAVLQIMTKNDAGVWTEVEGKMAPVKLFEGELDAAAQEAGIRTGRSISVVYAGGSADQIIPTYITKAMPTWFGLLFLLTLLAAAMSTLSSQFHAVGTSIGRDVYEQLTERHEHSIIVNRTGIIIGIIIAMLWSYYARGGYIIARATAIFFGLCASAFLPAFIGGLFWKRITRPAAIASMVAGFVVTAFWLLFVKAAEAGDIGLVQKLTGGQRSILANSHNWPVVDPLVVALPVSVIVAVVVSLLTKPPSQEHMSRCFK
ncbi:MAG: sodium:solute symporter family protein [Sedimentisphaerales bacterium]|nr:sodium:solute symporter family protein [Sedimentisphaerales bacterium]